MKITNKLGLPEPFVAAIRNDDYEFSGDISVTRLVKPPKVVQLEKRNAAAIEQDASTMVWVLLGKAVHYILERAGIAHTTEHLIEKEHVQMVRGWRVSGRLDVHDLTQGTLSDYKVTSVWSFIKGDKPEWERQLNLNAWLLRKEGYRVERLRIVAILRDWSVTRTHEPDYPATPTMVVDVPLWPQEDMEAYVHERVSLHQAAAELPDLKLPECSAEERWERPPTFAVQKPDAKRAWRVFDTREAATELAMKSEGYVVSARSGESVRCAHYCLALPFCNQGRNLVPKFEKQEVVIG